MEEATKDPTPSQKEMELSITYGCEDSFGKCKTALQEKYGDALIINGEKVDEDTKFEIKLNGEVIYDEGPPCDDDKMNAIYAKIDAASGGATKSETKSETKTSDTKKSTLGGGGTGG